MKLLTLFLALAAIGQTALAADSDSPFQLGHGFATKFSKRLSEVDNRLNVIQREMVTLPVMSDLDARGTHGYHSNFIFSSEDNWFQISWDQPRNVDGIGMIPTRIITQSGLRANYGLPSRMRIEATGPGHVGTFTLAEIANTRLDLRLGEPIFIDLPATAVTSLRFVPIDLPTLPGKFVRFFSLAEVMVYQGQENIAYTGKFSSAFSIDSEAGWNLGYLTDSQSPLGPPELPIVGKSFGWHADMAGADVPTWAVVDLGSKKKFDAIRLVAARGDAPIKGPGFGFPVNFQLESADDAVHGPWTTLWTTSDTYFVNPGYNPTMFRIPPTAARYVRIMVTKRHAPDHFTIPRVLVSELEVLHEGKNLALGAAVDTPDKFASINHDATRIWSRAGLTDGYSSTGKLIPERQWVSSLSRRFDLTEEMQRLAAERGQIIQRWHQWSLALLFMILSAVIFTLLFWQVRLRVANRRTMHSLRNRISSDLHDEVGSNLATIALLAELDPAPGNLEDIHRLSLESSLSLREIVEITIASKRARKPLLDRMREIASLMLREQKWVIEGTASPELDLERRRHFVFFFKEALHNIIRHADASEVSITFEKLKSDYQFTVKDDGKGIEKPSPDVMGNFRTLHQRAEALGGSLDIQSRLGQGTRLILRFPIHAKPRK